MSGFAFRRSSAKDACAISSLVAAAFGGPDEAALIETLRLDGDMIEEFVASHGDMIIAHIAFSKLDVRHGDATLRAAALAPLAVAPIHQRSGIGSALTRHALDELRRSGQQVVAVLGHPAYYPRFGFSALLAKALDAPYSGASFMVLELTPGVLAAKRWKVCYPPAFAPKSADDRPPRNR